MKYIELYTSGSCISNNGAGGWSFILKYNVHTREESGWDLYTTNHRMEMMAIIAGLSVLKERCQVLVITRSKYVADAVNKGWLQNWVKEGYKGRKNADLWIKLVHLISLHDTTFTLVEGHGDNEYSKKCNKKAIAESNITR